MKVMLEVTLASAMDLGSSLLLKAYDMKENGLMGTKKAKGLCFFLLVIHSWVYGKME
jgi:hypothetical protein